jgi:hypothetical protein
MKKPRNTAVTNRIAVKKGNKKLARKKIAKKHLDHKRLMKEHSKRREERIWQEYYDSLMNAQQ